MVRYTAIPKVDCSNMSLKTKYRYRMVGYKVGTNWHTFDQIKHAMEREYPDVFSDDGIPFVLSESKVNSEQNYVWTAVIGLCSAFTLPIINEHKNDYKYAVQVGDIAPSEYNIRYEKGSSVTLFSPIGALFWHGKPDMGGYKGFYGSFFNENVGADNMYAINRSAIAYGVAVKLMELEMAGKIVQEKLKRKPSPVVHPSQSTPVQKQNILPDKKPAGMPAPAVPRSIQVYEVEDISL